VVQHLLVGSVRSSLVDDEPPVVVRVLHGDPAIVLVDPLEREQVGEHGNGRLE